MAEQREIDGWRNAYKAYSRAELIRVMHSNVEHCAERIAAKQSLDALDERAQRRILKWTMVAAVAAIIGALAAILANISVFRH
jgi:hypothetical protein